MTSIISILFQTILPILLVAGAGYGVQRWLKLDVRSLSRVCLYILTPCLGFSSMATSKMAKDALWRMAATTTLVLLCMVALGWLVARLLSCDRRQCSALQLSLAFPNSGNFGLSLVLLAFGEVGLSLGIVYFVTSSLLTNSLGVFLASRGGKATSIKTSVRNMLSMPLLYAAILGLAFNFSGLTVPDPLLKATDLAGKAAAPAMLIVLGMQLASARVRQDWRLLSLGTVLKLVVAPLVAVAVAGLLRLNGVAWQIAILETATPTAVSTVIISEEFEASPAFASSMVLVTTIFSLVTLTATLALIS